jgi:hypothetical protein
LVLPRRCVKPVTFPPGLGRLAASPSRTGSPPVAAIAGCIGAIQTTAVDAEGAGGLKPTQEDTDAGLVGMATGFNLKDYQIVVV